MQELMEEGADKEYKNPVRRCNESMTMTKFSRLCISNIIFGIDIILIVTVHICMGLVRVHSIAIDLQNLSTLQKSGFTALIAATTNGRFDCVRVLLKGGADKNAKDRVRGMRIYIIRCS